MWYPRPQLERGKHGVRIIDPKGQNSSAASPSSLGGFARVIALKPLNGELRRRMIFHTSKYK